MEFDKNGALDSSSRSPSSAKNHEKNPNMTLGDVEGVALILLSHPSATVMISRFCAVTLIALVLSPFTAPFSTCDFSFLLSHRTPNHSAPAPRIPHTSAATTANTAIAVSRPSASTREHIRRLALSRPLVRARCVVVVPISHSAPIAPPALDVTPFAVILRL